MKQYWKLSCFAAGIKKRARKQDTHNSSTLATFEQIPDDDAMQSICKNWLASNMKQTNKAWASLTFWTQAGPGVEQWQPFNEEHNLRKEIKL